MSVRKLDDGEFFEVDLVDIILDLDGTEPAAGAPKLLVVDFVNFVLIIERMDLVHSVVTRGEAMDGVILFLIDN